MIKPSDFLQLAHELAQHDGEVYLRESIIAAYYAVFHECKMLSSCLENHGGMGSQSGSHEDLLRKLSAYPMNNAEGFKQDIVRKIKSLGYKLKECRNNRRVASYELQEDVTHAQHYAHLKIVQSMMQQVSELHTLPEFKKATPTP